MTKTLNLLERELEQAKQVAGTKANAEKRLAEYVAELERQTESIAKLKMMGDAVASFDASRPKGIMTGSGIEGTYNRLVKEAGEAVAVTRQKLAEYRDALVAAENAEKRASAIKDAITQRKQQIGRFRGTLGIIGKPFGQKHFYVGQDLDLVRDMAMYANGSGETSVGAEELRARINERWQQAEADVKQWKAENEVSDVAIRIVRYSGKGWNAETSILYRAIQEGDGVKRFMTIDPAARFLQLPFGSHDVTRRLSVRDVGALVEDWSYSEDDKGELTKVVTIKELNFV